MCVCGVLCYNKATENSQRCSLGERSRCTKRSKGIFYCNALCYYHITTQHTRIAVPHNTILLAACMKKNRLKSVHNTQTNIYRYVYKETKRNREGLRVTTATESATRKSKQGIETKEGARTFKQRHAEKLPDSASRAHTQ